MEKFSTSRLRFITVNPSFAEKLFPIWSDYDVTKFTMIKNIKTVNDCRKRIIRHVEQNKLYNALGPYIIKHNGEVIGYCGGMLQENNKDEYEIFYHLSKNHWGNGFGTETAHFLVDKAFSLKNVKSVTAEAVISNIQSWKILEKIEMKRIIENKEAFENIEGKYDAFIYRIGKNNH